ncbi:MAG: helix-turn-helix domain-containing protein [Flavobacteriales bacterium]
MKNSSMSVQDVAYEIGYDNPSHFISAFKKKYNITPKKYST